jgi:uncharacterized linocin/CFP29 family protein
MVLIDLNNIPLKEKYEMVAKKKVVVKKEVVEEVKPKQEAIASGMARVEYHGKIIESDAIHALTVLSKRGGNILDINLDEQVAITFCNNYEINYPSPATKSNLMEAITKRF